MKNFLFLLLALLISFAPVYAQRSKQLNGKGKVLTVNQDIQAFTELKVSGMVGTMRVDASPTAAAMPSVSVAIDENLRPLLLIEQKGNTVTVALKGNENNRLWIEDNHIVVTVVAPALEKIVFAGNGNTSVAGIDRDDFVVQHVGNANITLTGRTKNLTVRHEGNGDVLATGLVADKADVLSAGNGSVRVTATSLKKLSSGNGGVFNSTDVAAASSSSTAPAQTVKLQYVHVKLANPTGKHSLSVRGPNEDGSYFSYGFGIDRMSTRKEHVPVGTEFRRAGITIYTVKAEDDGKRVEL